MIYHLLCDPVSILYDSPCCKINIRIEINSSTYQGLKGLNAEKLRFFVYQPVTKKNISQWHTMHSVLSIVHI